jgi:predicted nucleic acid-binding protein
MNWDRFAGEAIYLDTNIVIFAIEAHLPWSTILRPLFEAIDRGTIRAVTSELTIAEVLTKPIELGSDALIERYQELFAPSSVLKMIPIDRAVLALAAEIRGQLQIKLIDSIHVATARLPACHRFLTQDERLGRALADEPHWLHLREGT